MHLFKKFKWEAAGPQMYFEHSGHFSVDFTHHENSERGIYEVYHDGSK